MIVPMNNTMYTMLQLLDGKALSVYEIADQLHMNLAYCKSIVHRMFRGTSWIKRATLIKVRNNVRSRYVYSTTQYGRNKMDRYVVAPTRPKPYAGDLIGA